MLMVVFPQGTFIPTSRAVGRSKIRGGQLVMCGGHSLCPPPGPVLGGANWFAKNWGEDAPWPFIFYGSGCLTACLLVQLTYLPQLACLRAYSLSNHYLDIPFNNFVSAFVFTLNAKQLDDPLLNSKHSKAKPNSYSSVIQYQVGSNY